MAVPGPGALGDLADLLLLAFLAALLGEPLRALLARRSGWLGSLDPLERGLVDLFLGGGMAYAVAALPIPLYRPADLVVAGGVLWAIWWGVRRASVSNIVAELRRVGQALVQPPRALVILAATGLLLVELAATDGIPTGNTYDSSLYATYLALLTLHQTVPTSFLPIYGSSIAFPQGSTVWFSLGAAVGGWPPIRASLLATPLFLAAGVPAAYSLGRRWVGDDRSGLAFGLTFAFLAPFPRDLVGGSNDFVLALPLVILLLGATVGWTGARPPGWADALAFGGLAGIAASINPVGVQWLFLLLPVAALLGTPRLGGSAVRWFSRWLGAIVPALAFLLPSLAILVRGTADRGYLPGGVPVPVTGGVGTTVAQFWGEVDPFLYRASDTFLSPLPGLRDELTVLIVLGAAILILGRRTPALDLGAFPRLAASAGLAALVMLAMFLVAGTRLPGLSDLVFFSSATESSVLLFLVYSSVAALPLAVLFRWLPSPGRPRPPRWAAAGPGTPPVRPELAAVAALIVLLPGLALTAAALPGVYAAEYRSYSQVDDADLALLRSAANQLPAGTRVLVAPGSAAEFLPSYDPELEVLYPMVPNFAAVDPAYSTLVADLTNGTLPSNASALFAGLGVGAVAVTGVDTTLFPAFSPTPLESDPQCSVAFHDGADWLFRVAPT